MNFFFLDIQIPKLVVFLFSRRIDTKPGVKRGKIYFSFVEEEVEPPYIPPVGKNFFGKHTCLFNILIRIDQCFCEFF